MMDTILNLGLNEATAEGLGRAVGDADFAADCLRRFHESYRAVIGAGSVPEDPWEQLRAAIGAVFASWNSDRAVAYRSREDIGDDLGTAVTVQAMVFGNRGDDSGTGVLFTRNPSTGERELFGDVLFNAQGEDVVGGTHDTQPISALNERLPSVAADLRHHADVVERHFADVADIEFTIEDGRLWMLQARVGKRSPRAALRMAIDMATDDDFPLTREQAVARVAPLLGDTPREFVREGTVAPAITRGLAASPGVAFGRIVTTSDEAEAAAANDEQVILVRAETSPEDVRGMAKAAGILTSRGGIASHAAVVARGWGIPAVVGAGDVVLGRSGVVSIDGSSGEVFEGQLSGSWRVVPEAETLLEWARELSVPIERPPEPSARRPDQASATAATASLGALSGSDLLRTLAIKGSATTEQLAESLDAESTQVEPLLDGLVSSGLAENAAGQVRLTANGKLQASSAFAEQRAAASVDEARAGLLLDEFHDLDARMKQIVTDWQVRDAGGEQVLNDHSDATYDANLLEQLATLNADTAAWLAPMTAERQFAAYARRLDVALGAARAGDQRFMASPRVDSFHSVWFELHEHLIRLTGRRREEVGGT